MTDNKLKNMKPIRTLMQTLSAITLLAFAAGCASTKSTENNLVAAGFKIITPSTPAQAAKLQALPAGKVTITQEKGKTYYVFPDKAHNQAYIGGPKQYQAYQALRAQQQLANEKLEAAELNQESAAGFGAWGGGGQLYGM